MTASKVAERERTSGRRPGSMNENSFLALRPLLRGLVRLPLADPLIPSSIPKVLSQESVDT